jgi:hypothetical protein
LELIGPFVATKILRDFVCQLPWLNKNEGKRNPPKNLRGKMSKEKKYKIFEKITLRVCRGCWRRSFINFRDFVRENLEFIGLGKKPRKKTIAAGHNLRRVVKVTFL